ncbi:alpha/beta hydrolase family protein [Paraburkholderia elongata]|uniref:Alpha/beta fold hydrolase n=1 Tax=Paraburkholderia elongata TaxID=2675747 RepID=A0A972NNS6_9BURK|nr:alpha/beta hydrolase [Paraburkholderia elongata]NPT55157.1 alpha/beta fold hydrolase [Paraburkholderia elongata]
MRNLLCKVTAYVLLVVGLTPTAQPIDIQEYLAIKGPTPQATFNYGAARSQVVEFFRPAGRGPFPVAILIHGGCWLSEYGGLEQFRALAAALARQGVATWSIEYRRVDEAGGGYPGTFEDIAAAVDMLGAKSAQLGLDPLRVIAVGHSAGADLALWAAARGKIPEFSPLFEKNPLRIPTVISVGGLPDLRTDAATIARSCRIATTSLTGTPSDARPDVFADTSPAAMLPDGVDTIGINGAEDTIAPPYIAQAYAALARQKGDQARVIVVDGADHLDEATTSSTVWPVLDAAILEALRIRK